MGFTFLIEAIIALLAFQGFGAIAGVALDLNFSDGISPADLLLLKVIQVPLALAMISGLLSMRGQNFASVGFRAPSNGWASAFKIGAAAVLPLMAAAWGVSRMAGFFDFGETQPFEIAGRWAFPAFLLVGVIAGGVAEEIQFRGYLFTRLEYFFAHWGKAAATRRAALFTSLLFASLHMYEGTAVVAAIFVVSLALQALYLFCGRNLVSCMVCHSLFNGVQITLLFSVS